MSSDPLSGTLRVNGDKDGVIARNTAHDFQQLFRFERTRDRVGRTSAVDGFVGWHLTEWADFRKEKADLLGEYQLSIDLPVETTQVDLYVHHSLTTAPDVAATLLDTMQASLTATSVEDIPALPLSIETIPLGMTNPKVDTPLLANYGDMIRDGFEALGSDSSTYSGWRAVIEFPPIPSRLALFQKLPIRGSDAG